MFKFQSFKVSDTEAINSFLAEKLDKIAPKGINYHDGYINFLFSDEVASVVEKDILKAKMIEHLDVKIDEYQRMIVDSESIVRYWRGMAARGVDKAARNVVETADQKDNQIVQLKALMSLREEVRTDAWYVESPTITGTASK